MSTPEVPFYPTGTGQRARHVVQVLGKNGHHFNPKGIRYMALPASGLANVAVALSAANVIISAANLAVSIAILDEVRKNGRKLDRLLQITDEINSTVQRIEVEVGHIRDAQDRSELWGILQKAMTAAEQSDGIDLTPLLPLRHNFMNVF